MSTTEPAPKRGGLPFGGLRRDVKGLVSSVSRLVEGQEELRTAVGVHIR
ncbi:MAG: hypothetical protein ACYDH5_19550 [Acidimicrobiales bacterium]